MKTYKWPIFSSLPNTLLGWGKSLADLVKETSRIETQLNSLVITNDWVPINDRWTYLSATTITVPGNGLNYAVGDRLRLSQDGGTTYKYFYIVSVLPAFIVVTAGNVYTVANAPITNIAISKAVSPLGFPDVFTWTPTHTGISAGPIASVNHFSMVGRKIFLSVVANAATSNATSWTMTAPLTARTVTNKAWGASLYYLGDNSAIGVYGTGSARIASASNIITLYNGNATGLWTAANFKSAEFELWYER